MSGSEGGFIYAVVFDNAVVKIGMSGTALSARHRINSHRNHGYAFGHETILIECVEVTGVSASLMEDEMLFVCHQVAELKSKIDRGEWFKFRSPEIAVEFIKASLPFIIRSSRMDANEICNGSDILMSNLNYFMEFGQVRERKVKGELEKLDLMPSHLIIAEKTRVGGRGQSKKVAIAIKLLEMNPTMSRYEASKKVGITPGALYNSNACQALMARRKG